MRIYFGRNRAVIVDRYGRWSFKGIVDDGAVEDSRLLVFDNSVLNFYNYDIVRSYFYRSITAQELRQLILENSVLPSRRDRLQRVYSRWRLVESIFCQAPLSRSSASIFRSSFSLNTGSTFNLDLFLSQGYLLFDGDVHLVDVYPDNPGIMSHDKYIDLLSFVL